MQKLQKIKKVMPEALWEEATQAGWQVWPRKTKTEH